MFSKEIQTSLTRPFPDEAISFVGLAKVRDKETGKTKAVWMFPYVEAPVLIERFNEIFPGQWSNTLTVINENTIKCTISITVDGEKVSHSGIGSGNGDDALKSAESDAFKRASRLFGVGLEIWSDFTKVLSPCDGYGNPTMPRDELLARSRSGRDNHEILWTSAPAKSATSPPSTNDSGEAKRLELRQRLK